MSYNIEAARHDMKEGRENAYGNAVTKGLRTSVPRTGKPDVEVFLYRPKHFKAPAPVIFNIHGGAWIAADASCLDDYCVDMAEQYGAFVVGVNYIKGDEQPFPYQQEEIIDTIKYYSDRAGEYGLDRERFALMGFSAGAHLSASACLIMRELGIKISAQVLCYPFLDFTDMCGLWDEEDTKGMMFEMLFDGANPASYINSPLLAANDQLEGLTPAIVIGCGKDFIVGQAEKYYKRLSENGVKAEYMVYDEAEHGFIEVYHPDRKTVADSDLEGQALYARQAEDDMQKLLEKFWKEV